MVQFLRRQWGGFDFLSFGAPSSGASFHAGRPSLSSPRRSGLKLAVWINPRRLYRQSIVEYRRRKAYSFGGYTSERGPPFQYSASSCGVIFFGSNWRSVVAVVDG